MQEKDDIFALVDLIRETSFELHKYLRHGHLEKIYENGLAHRLRKAGIKVEQQYPRIQAYSGIEGLQGFGAGTYRPAFGVFAGMSY